MTEGGGKHTYNHNVSLHKTSNQVSITHRKLNKYIKGVVTFTTAYTHFCELRLFYTQIVNAVCIDPYGHYFHTHKLAFKSQRCVAKNIQNNFKCVQS
jgi:hypothetical protein